MNDKRKDDNRDTSRDHPKVQPGVPGSEKQPTGDPAKGGHKDGQESDRDHP